MKEAINVDFNNKQKARRLSRITRNKSNKSSNQDSPICIDYEDLSNKLEKNLSNLPGEERKVQYDFVHTLPPFFTGYDQLLGIVLNVNDWFINNKTSIVDH